MTDKKYYEYGRNFPAVLEPKKGTLAYIRENADAGTTHLSNSGVTSFLKDNINPQDLPDGFLDKANKEITRAFELVEEWAHNDTLSLEEVKSYQDEVITRYNALFKQGLMTALKNTRDSVFSILKYESGVEKAVTEAQQALKLSPTLESRIAELMNRPDVSVLDSLKYSEKADMSILSAITEDILKVFNGTEMTKSGIYKGISIKDIHSAWENLASTLQRPEVHGALTQTTIDELKDVLGTLKQRMDTAIFDKHASLPPAPAKAGAALG